MPQIPTRLLENVKHATEILAGVTTELQMNVADPGVVDTQTFTYLDVAMVALTKALQVNGVRVSW